MRRWISILLAGFLYPASVWAATTAPSAEKTAVSDNNAFAVALYHQLDRQSGNLFFSPESISMALAMTYAGAHGDTAAQMARALHFSLPADQLHPAMGDLLRSLNTPHQGYTLTMANALWAQKGYGFLADFMDLTRKDYGGAFYGIEFKSAPEQARQLINQWADEQTAHKITDLLPPGIVTPATRLVLTNAVYFKGDWDSQFDKTQTRDEAFHLSAAQTTQTPMMHQTSDLSYYDGGTFKAVAIPYKSRELSMIVFLPNAPDGLPAFEQSLSPEKLQQWLSQMQPDVKVILSMPKFTMAQEFKLKDTLAAMGMPLAFDPEKADFTGMAPKAEMQRQDGPNANLYISAVIHKAYVGVDEQGTEAAGATAGMAATPMGMVLVTAIFRADHPFLFLIRDNRSGSILFLGRVNDPAH